MTKSINAYAMAKGYQILKVPVRKRLPLIGWLTLPTWLTYKTEYVSRKHCVYSVFGLAEKIGKKLQKKARKINQRIINPYNQN